MHIDRVILSSNDNPNYLQFWPIIAKAWKDKIGVKPTLALIGDGNIEVDESLGDVIRFKPIPGIDSGFQARTIRLIMPCYFEDEVCILSDIDMLPINKTFLLGSISNFSDDKFIIYNDMLYKLDHENEALFWPICYNVAKGKTFKEILGIENLDNPSELIKYWYDLNFQFKLNAKFHVNNEYLKKLIVSTDERMLAGYLKNWNFYSTKCIKLGNIFDKQIDRADWDYDKELLKNEYYTDAHLPLNYNATKSKEQIDKLLIDLEWEDIIPS